ncbi:MAG TPA: hypothetical protein VJM51_09565 [Dehalococcoidia bacterium]|nr:hypothetical protein [Dehalococcoidia bacterium]
MIMRSLTMRSVAIAAVVVVAAMATMATPALAARGEGGPKNQASATLTLTSGSSPTLSSVPSYWIHGEGTGYKANKPAYLKISTSSGFASYTSATTVAASDGTLSFDVAAYGSGTNYVAVYQWLRNQMQLMASGEIALP